MISRFTHSSYSVFIATSRAYLSLSLSYRNLCCIVKWIHTGDGVVNKHHTEDDGKATRPLCRYTTDLVLRVFLVRLYTTKKISVLSYSF
jgi:hypothetical protein